MGTKQEILEALRSDPETRLVAIVETEVLGVKAYHGRCLKCGWESRRQDRKKQAVAMAGRHVCKAR